MFKSLFPTQRDHDEVSINGHGLSPYQPEIEVRKEVLTSRSHQTLKTE